MRPKQRICSRQPRPKQKICRRQPQMRPKQRNTLCSRQPQTILNQKRNLYDKHSQPTYTTTEIKLLLPPSNHTYQSKTSRFIKQNKTTPNTFGTTTRHIITKSNPSKPWGRPDNSTNHQSQYPPWGRHHRTNQHNNPHQASWGRMSSTHHLPQQPTSIQLIHQHTKITRYTYYVQPARNTRHYLTIMMTRTGHQITNMPYLQTQPPDKYKTTKTQHLHNR